MIVPVLLCGGSGTRLWPLSRKSYPKQFAQLTRDHTLLQAAADRVSGAGFAPPIILTQSDFRFIVPEQLAGIGIEPGPVLLEPEGRNTAPAILAAALWQARSDPEAVMLVTPSDHVIPDRAGFDAAVSAAATAARDGQVVTLGIEPTRPETGYGYLELTQREAGPEDATGPLPLKGFVEKPDADRAAAMLATGGFLWNAGIFVFTAQTIIEAFRHHAPAMLDQVGRAIDQGRTDLGFFRLDPGAWAQIENISIDYAVMEKLGTMSVVRLDSHWSDLGGWDAVWRDSRQDEAGVRTSGTATAIDCQDTLLRSETASLELVGIGLENIIAVAMPDAVLVADASRAQDVKLAVAALKEKGAPQADSFPRDYRPWGWFESLGAGARFQVKRIVVKPGAALSLQSHHHRAEHWIVVEGTARVTIGEVTSLVSENQSIYIPLGEKHRLENPGKLPMVLIEVQTGAYLGEDDIVRYEDLYARNSDEK